MKNVKTRPLPKWRFHFRQTHLLNQTCFHKSDLSILVVLIQVNPLSSVYLNTIQSTTILIFQFKFVNQNALNFHLRSLAY